MNNNRPIILGSYSPSENGIILNVITAHYSKDGESNILPNTNSQTKAAAILLEYE